MGTRFVARLESVDGSVRMFMGELELGKQYALAIALADSPQLPIDDASDVLRRMDDDEEFAGWTRLRAYVDRDAVLRAVEGLRRSDDPDAAAEFDATGVRWLYALARGCIGLRLALFADQ